MALSVDVGGTHTRLALFEASSIRAAGDVWKLRSRDIGSLDRAITDFLAVMRLPASALVGVGIGIAGVVENGIGRLTNGGLEVRAGVVKKRLGAHRVVLLNDLVAAAHGMVTLSAQDISTIQGRPLLRTGRAAVIGLGTGMNVVLLEHRDGETVFIEGESGHADYCPTDRRMIGATAAFVRRRRIGRVSVETVLSGPGLRRLAESLHDAQSWRGHRKPVVVTEAAEHGCAQCGLALRLFTKAFAAEAGNVALRFLPSAGVFLYGGLASSLEPNLRGPGFAREFCRKKPMERVLGRIPVAVILREDLGLRGAAVAVRLASARAGVVRRP